MKTPEYDQRKFWRFIVADLFLMYAYCRQKNRRPDATREQVCEALFHSYVVGDSAMEHAYETFK